MLQTTTDDGESDKSFSTHIFILKMVQSKTAVLMWLTKFHMKWITALQIWSHVTLQKLNNLNNDSFYLQRYKGESINNFTQLSVTSHMQTGVLLLKA